MTVNKQSLMSDVAKLNERLVAIDVEAPVFDEQMTNKNMKLHKKQLQKMIIDAGIGQPGDAAAVEEYNPDGFAAVTAASAGPFKSIEQISKETDMPERVVKAILTRLKNKYPNTNHLVRVLGTSELLQSLDEKIAMTLEHIDPFVLAKASYRELTQGLTHLIQNKQLLSGEPTQIISLEDRRKIKEIMPQLFKEAGRRGITIDQKD